MINSADSDLAPRFSCARCGDVIGVYEPLTTLTRQGARETSRAAEPQLPATHGRDFHRACYLGDRDATPIRSRKPS
jgi:hypothetical protein